MEKRREMVLLSPKPNYYIITGHFDNNMVITISWM